MPRFATAEEAKNVRGPVRSGSPTRTYEGGEGHTRSAKGDLFLLGVTNFVGQDTFYESAEERDMRFVELVHAVTREDPAWVAAFAKWLRGPEANIRTAALIVAVEYVRAGGSNGRDVVDSVIQRPDELAETLAYWHMVEPDRPKGGSWPIKRGVAKAFSRLIGEFQALKYDSNESAWRLGDVMALVRPTPRDDTQAALFRFIRDRQFHRNDDRAVAVIDQLPMVQARKALYAMTTNQKYDLLAGRDAAVGLLKAAGMTWEDVGAWLGGPMSAVAWEAIIPSMGYMALLRNLRNFEQAGVSSEALMEVQGRLVDPEGVAKSRQLPMRFYSAWKAGQSMTFGPAIEKALNACLVNVPHYPGKTLVLIDRSGSMDSVISKKSTLKRRDLSALFGSAVAVRSDAATIVGYGDTSAEVRQYTGGAILRQMGLINDIDVGWSTYGWTAFDRHFDGHDRVLMFTDEQQHDSPARPLRDYGTRFYIFNLAGYSRGMGPSTGEDPLWTFGGFTDATFKLISLLERGRDAKWPWE